MLVRVIVTGNGPGFSVVEVLVMALTATERQAAFRRRMKERGFRLMQIWVDAEGFPGRSRAGRQSPRPEYTKDQLIEVLEHVTTGTDEDFTAKLFGELAAYAKGVRELWEISRQSPKLFTPANDNDKDKMGQSSFF
ncbi:MAG: hypothetical protein LBQ67_06405 [Treponema sp.]|jgi:hypothetical protein|nr:hypothetical protein [Treponema sp.]